MSGDAYGAFVVGMAVFVIINAIIVGLLDEILKELRKR